MGEGRMRYNKSMKIFKINNQESGFAPIIIIAIIAVLAVGGGAYVAQKNKVKKEMQLDANVETQVNANLDVEAKANVNAKGSLRSLLAIGQNTMCTFTSTAGGITSSGTTYIGSNGDMSGNFSSTTSSGTVASYMVMKGGMSYAWSGNQGVKMNVAEMNANSATSSNGQSVNLDSQVDYKCEPWVRDESKFTLPTSVTFMDLSAMMKMAPGATTPSGIDVNAMMKLKAQ